jgi:hypothetical protein
MQNKVVAHFLDNKILKGVTSDFYPTKNFFHLAKNESGETQKIDILELKAVYFVKTFEGEANYHELHDIERSGLGKKIEVRFKDGEAIIGYTQGFSPNRPGFFVFPPDPKSNNDRIFVVNASTDDIHFV